MALINGITDDRQQGMQQEALNYQAPTSTYAAIEYLFDEDPDKFSLRSYSRDNILGRRELQRYLKDHNVNLDPKTIEAILRVYNERFGNYTYGNNTSRNALDRQLISNALYSAKQRTRRINPWTGEEYYVGDTNYNSGVATEAEAQAIRAKYTPMQEKFARHLLDLAYTAYQKGFTSTEIPVQEFEGNDIWDGTTSIDKATAFNLIRGAGQQEPLRINNSWGNSSLLNSIQYGSKSKKAMDEALKYYKEHNPSLYNKLISNKEFLSTYTTNSNNWEKLNSTVSDKPLSRGDWFNNLTDDQKNEINSQVNNLANLQEFERTQIPKSTTMSTAFNVNNMVGYRKNGGTMRKYQQGGQAPTAAQMVLQALSAAQQGDQRGLQQLFSDEKTAQAVIQQLQKEAQEGSEEAIQALEALKQLMGGDKKQAAMAQKGAKIAYIHRLSTGCPEGTELKYFKRGGQLCKACVKKAKKAKEGESLDSVIAKNKRRYPGITDDQAAGRAPIRKNGKDYYLGGDGVLSEASKKGKYGFGGFFEYFKCGGKSKKSKCGTKAKCGAELAKCGAELEKCGGKAKKSKCGMKAEYGAEFEKCGGKAKKPKCGTKAKCGAELAKCGIKTTLAKCGTKAQEGAELEKCGGKAKRKRYFC